MIYFAIPNETTSQKNERIHNTISHRYDELIKAHTQAKKNGRIKASLATILKDFPLLLSFIKQKITPKELKSIAFNKDISMEVKKELLEEIPSSIKITDLEPVQNHITERQAHINKAPHPASVLPQYLFDELEEDNNTDTIKTEAKSKVQNSILDRYDLTENDIRNFLNTPLLDPNPYAKQNRNIQWDDDEGDALNVFDEGENQNNGTLNFRGNTYNLKLGTPMLEERYKSVVNALARLERNINVPTNVISIYNASGDNVLKRLQEIDNLPQGTKNIRAQRQNVDDIASELIKRINGVIIGYNNKGKTRAKTAKAKPKGKAQVTQQQANEWQTQSGAWSDADFEDPYNNNDDQFISEDDPQYYMAQQYRQPDPFHDYNDDWDTGTPQETLDFGYENARPIQALDLHTAVPNITKIKHPEFKPHTEKERRRALEKLQQVTFTPYDLEDVDEYTYKNPDVKNPLEAMEGLGKKRRALIKRKVANKKPVKKALSWAIPKGITFF